jgi:hypothetical protein
MGKISALFKKKHFEFSSLEPVSRSFGFDRGLPIDRYYIENFLNTHKACIQGNVLEVGNNVYTKKFGTSVKHSDILIPTGGNNDGKIVGDLNEPESLPHNSYDCFICTQVLNFIQDYPKAIIGIHRLLKQGGIVLATLAGLTQISRYDMDRWGDYWRFTDLSANLIFSKVFDPTQVKVETHGNVLSAIGILQGLAAEEIGREILDQRDQDYQIVITVRAQKIETH